MTNPSLIKKPHVTERSTELGAFDKYVFVVDSSATAPEVKKLIQSIYGVKVVKVNILNTKTKKSRLRNLITKRRSKIKKAVVTLKSGDKIDIIPQ